MEDHNAYLFSVSHRKGKVSTSVTIDLIMKTNEFSLIQILLENNLPKAEPVGKYDFMSK